MLRVEFFSEIAIFSRHLKLLIVGCIFLGSLFEWCGFLLILCLVDNFQGDFKLFF